MNNTERELGKGKPSEKKKNTDKEKKKKGPKTTEPEKKTKKAPDKQGETEKGVEAKMEEFSKKFSKLTQEIGEAAEGVAGFKIEVVRTTESLVSLREAFELLEKQVREGNIKSLKELESFMGRITNGIKAKYEQALARQKKLDDLLEDEVESREKIKDLRGEGAAELAASIAAQELAAEKLRDLAMAAEAAGFGMGMGMGGEKPPDWKDTPRDEIDKWFVEKLKKMVMTKTPFSENWRMSWDLERFLGSIPKEERAAYQHYAGIFDRARIEHTCFLSYDAAANVEAVQGVLGNLSLSTVEGALKEKGVVEELMEYQKDAEKIVELRAEVERLREEKKNKKADVIEREMGNWLIRMKRRLDGKELKMKIEDKKEVPDIDENPSFDEERGLAKIEAGRMFIFLGMAAGYDIGELTGGDFSMARINHLLNRIKAKSGEGDRWWKREKLVNWMTQVVGNEKEIEIDPKTGEPTEKLREIIGLEVFTHKFGGGFFANLFRKQDQAKNFSDLGLEWSRKWVGNRLINVIKIRDKDKLRKINFEAFGVARENQLSADILDSARNADEVRSQLFGHQGYLDQPTFENYLKFSDLFKHLRGSKDEIGIGEKKPKGGTERDRLMVLLHRDWLDFYKGPGKATRFFGTLLTAGVLPALKPEYRFIRPMRVIDPETGKEKFLGYSLGDSDGELLRLGRSLNSVDVHGYIDDAVSKNCYSPQYAEGLLRNQIKLFKVIPGIGPIRVTQEVIDKIGIGGFLGGILFFIFAPILEFAKQLGKQFESR